VAQTWSSDSEDYVSLYRRYRPQRFDQLAGQEHVALALSHAVETGKVPHAYLLSGPRGTGKTSAARILAKALNCESPTGGEPCNACPSCISITEGASLDVVELDAASHNGVEDVRELIASVSLATPGRYRVFIVDEVHMLSNAASNALLKTLEEPPSHVVFVLATTDPHKVPPTIRSRTVHLHFNLLDGALLEELLSSVAEKESMALEREVIDRAVGLAKGSARDALSALEHLAVAGVRGVEDEQRIISDLLEGLIEGDPHKALSVVASGIHAGMEPSRIASGAIEVLRQGFLSILAPELVELAPPEKERIEEQARSFGLAPLVAAIEALGKALSEMPSSYDPLVPLELAVARIVTPEISSDLGALQDRVERLESRLDQALAGLSQGAAVPVRQRPSSPGGKEGPSPMAARPNEAENSEGAPPRVAPPTQKDLSEGAPPRVAPPTQKDPVPGRPSPTQASHPKKEVAARGSEEYATPKGTKFFGVLHREAQGSGSGTATGTGIRPESQGDRDPHIPRVKEDEKANRSTEERGARASDTVPREAVKPEGGVFNRDALVIAWPDAILPRLSVPARSAARLGRFLEVEGSAVTMALPQEGHVETASRHKSEIEAAIAAAFGLPDVALFLVVDEGDAGHRAQSQASGPSSTRPRPGSPASSRPGLPTSSRARRPVVVEEPPVEAKEDEPEEEPDLDAEPENPVQLTLRFFPGSSIEDLEEQ